MQRAKKYYRRLETQRRTLEQELGYERRSLARDSALFAEGHIAPASESPVIGKLKVPSSGFGKVAVGQEVKIRLSGFPYLEFGILRGTVVAIAPVPESTQEGLVYTVDVVLPDGLLSTYRRELPFVQNMDGTAEIITEDLRLLQQLVQPIRALFAD